MGKKALILILSVIMLSGCLESNVYIIVNNDYSGEVKISYSISGESEYVSSDLAAMKYQFLPVDENSLKQITDQDDGLYLKEYRKDDRGSVSLISFAVGFSSLDKVEKLSQTNGSASLLRISSPSKGNIRIALRSPFSEDTSEQTITLLKALYEDKILNFRIKVPGFLTTTNIGELSDDPAEAELKISFNQLADSKNDIIWDLEYTSR